MITRSAEHIHVRCGGQRFRIRKAHVKAAFAYLGAFLMIADAGTALASSWGVEAIHHAEPIAGVAGKTGAALAGAAAFFDNLIRAALKEA